MSEVSTHKRKRSSGEGDVKNAKLPKAETTAETVPIAITDLHEYCFEKIFEFLDLMDLLNVISLSEQAEKAAKSVFARRYSQYMIKMCGYNMGPAIKSDDFIEVITINTAFHCEKFLSIFGKRINYLELFNFDEEMLTSEWTAVQDLINENCTGNLRELKLSNVKCALMDHIENAFEEVECLRISCSHLGKFIDLNKWFPKLRSLQLLHNDRCVQTVSSFPFLNYLAMDIKDECLSTACFKAMIKSAPKLETLSLSGAMKSDLLRYVSDISTELKHLNLWDFLLEDETDDVFMFDSVQTLSISTGLIGLLPSKIPFEFKQLTELRVITTESLGEPWINFAMAQRNLTKLVLDSSDSFEFSDSHLDDMAVTLNNLVELEIFGYVTEDSLLDFLSKSKTLQKLVIECDGPMDFSVQFGESIKSKWNIDGSQFAWRFERKHD